MLIEKKVNSIFRNTFIIRLVWGCSPQTLANFCVQKFDKKLYFSQATRLYAVGEQAMFYFLLKTGFAFIAPENVALRHSQTNKCANTSEYRVLRPPHRITPKRETECGLSLPSEAGGKRPARERDFQVCTKPTTRIVCSFNPPSAAGGKRPARERDFQVCTKPTTRIACRLSLLRCGSSGRS
mgnify:CR=1 FL=1